jgi:CRISPR-associated protein Cmr2
MRYLFTMSLGPVQGFIAAARRTRDLWAGSWLLSEVAKAAANCLHQNGATASPNPL